MKLHPLVKQTINRIDWRQFFIALFLLSIISIAFAAWYDDPKYVLITLCVFIVLTMYVVIDTFIQEYNSRKRFKFYEQNHKPRRS